MRVVSLVPSLTETLFALGLDNGTIAGRTAFCIHPAGLVDAVPVVGGTKTPSLRSLRRLDPDLVLLDREENRKEICDELEGLGFRTWSTHITQAAQVPAMIRELGDLLDRARRAAELADSVSRTLEALDAAAARRGPGPVVVPLIWNDPLMGLSPARYGGDLARRAGFRVPDLRPGEGYPKLEPSDLAGAGVEILLLTSEPHDFTIDEGEAVAAAVAGAGGRRPRCLKVDGQALTWFGARTAEAAAWWRMFREQG